MSDRLPAGFITNREIGASSTNPIDREKLEHVYKITENFGGLVSDGQAQIQVATRAKVGATAGWAVAAADNLPYVGTLPASQTGSTLILPLDGLPINATITGFRVVAQIESAGGAVTLDGDLRAVTNVAAEPTDASIATMTQVSVTADTAASQEKTGITEVVTSGKSYYLKITGTTAASTDVILQHCEVYYTNNLPAYTKRVILFVADKAGALVDCGAGLFTDGSSTAIAFDIQKGASTSMLSSTISVTSSTGDRTEVAGSISGTGAYASGDVISAVMTVTSATGAVGPWLRAVFAEDGD